MERCVACRPVLALCETSGRTFGCAVARSRALLCAARRAPRERVTDVASVGACFLGAADVRSCLSAVFSRLSRRGPRPTARPARPLRVARPDPVPVEDPSDSDPQWYLRCVQPSACPASPFKPHAPPSLFAGARPSTTGGAATGTPWTGTQKTGLPHTTRRRG